MIRNIITFLVILSLGFTTGVNAASVTVTEKIPGATCKCALTDQVGEEKCDTSKTESLSTLYECEVGDGFSSIMSIMGNIIKYFTFLAGLGGVLFIIVNGIMYSMGGVDDSLKSEAKKRILGTIVGLVLLLLSGVILKILAPWIYV